MLLTKQHRLRVLFISQRNPIWKELGLHKLKLTTFYKEIGTHPSSAKSWMRGEAFAERTMTRVFDNARGFIRTKIASAEKRSALLWAVDEFARLYHDAADRDKKVGLYEAGRALGMSLDDSQIIIDQTIAEIQPLLPTVYYDNNQREDIQRSTRDFARFRGIYFAWVKRGKNWLRCPLRVRYQLPLFEDRLIALRCKLNLPLIDRAQVERLRAVKREGSAPYFEYDGWLSCQEQASFASWIFEKRPDEDRVDYFQFITNYGLVESDRYFRLHGTYLTVSQDEPQAITSDIIILERMMHEGTDEQVIELMRQAGLADNVQRRRLDRLVAQMQGSRGGSPTARHP